MRRVVAFVSVLTALSPWSVAGASAGASTGASAGASAGPAVKITTGKQMTVDARVTLRAYTGLVEQHLGSVLTALAAVAASDDARSGGWDRIKTPLATIRHRVKTAAAVWYVRRDGSYFTTDVGLTNKNLSDRAYFAPLMAGRDIEGPLVVSKATGKLSAIVAAPIRVGRRVVGGLGASIDLVKLAKTVQRAMSFPSNVVFYAIDSSGRCALNKDTSLIFSFPSKLASPSLRTAVDEMLSTPRGSLSYLFRGAERRVVFMRSRVTGWIFAIGMVGR